jgi:hypothetical protein
VVIAGLAIFGSTFSGKPAGGRASGPLMAEQTRPIDLRSDRPTTENFISLDGTRVTMASLPEVDNQVANARLFPSTIGRERSLNGHQRRYVIDALPVSYEATKVSF